MFLGHYAVAFAAKRAAPTVSLGTLFLSVQLLDLLWPLLLLLGIEHVRIDPGNTSLVPLDFYDYPWSHGLLPVAVAGALLGALYGLRKHNRLGAWVIGLGVVSHWALDFVTHRPDLPLAPWSATLVGLGLWNSPGVAIALEGTLFLSSLALYTAGSAAADRTGKIAFWLLVAFLVIVWILNFVGPPPPSETAIAYSALLLWLLLPWGYWIERHRKTI